MRNSLALLLIFAVCMLLTGTSLPRALADNPFTVTITVQGLPSNLVTDLYVNGNYNGTLAGSASATYTLSSANSPYFFSVDSYVQGSNNATRYYCQNTTWSALSSGSQVFTYTAQYFLRVQTAYSAATGQGWYAAGSTANVSLNDLEVQEGQSTRNVFDGWSGNAIGAGLTSSVTMDAPKVAIANWKTQFLLTVQCNPANITGLSGSDWYDAGLQANFSAPPTMTVSPNERLRFNYWSGEYTGQQPYGTVSMDRPKTVKANYLPQYLLSVEYAPQEVANGYNETHAGWYDTNSDVQLGPAPTIINLNTVERLQFSGWSDDGTISNNLSYTVLVDRPRNVTLLYQPQYYLDVKSTYGTVTGSGWYSKGATANITAPVSSGTWPFSYTLTGWTVDPASEAVTNRGGSWVIVVDKPYVVQAQWSLDYLPLILLFGGGAVAFTVLAVGTLVAYKRGVFTRRRAVGSPEKTEPKVALPGSGVICSNCGNNVPKGLEFCDKCGNAIRPAHYHSEDDRVYEYIVKHQGVISLRTASSDLGISLEQLKEITERLKKDGRLV